MNHVNNRKPILRYFIIFILGYFLLFGGLYWIGSDQMEAVKVQTTAVTPIASDGGLVGNNVLEQRFVVQTDTLDQLLLYMGTYGRVNNSSFTLQIYEGDELLWQHGYMADSLKDLQFNAFVLEEPLQDVKGKKLLLRISTADVPIDQAISFYFGNTMSASKTEVAVGIQEPLYINGQPVDGILCLSVVGRDLLAVKALYWPLVSGIAVILCFVMLISWKQYTQKGTGLIFKLMGLKRYSFLMKQLVARDFKSKYKRSVLGVLWSFFNPLLTMGVQYLIFSTIFKSNIENFAVYLMTGIIIYNFFAESVGLGLTSIVANAALITKVYVPKYIYPFSRVLSSAVNVLISMIPLFIMIIISGIPLQKSILLFPLVLLYTIVFCMGMSLFLASAMVFFRDTQFLWGIISMLWMYMTPIFYPESIIPQAFLTLYHMNPLYQFTFFLREITLNGVAPGPYTFLYCTIAAVVPFLIGFAVFKKTQNRFVFYL